MLAICTGQRKVNVAERSADRSLSFRRPQRREEFGLRRSYGSRTQAIQARDPCPSAIWRWTLPAISTALPTQVDFMVVGSLTNCWHRRPLGEPERNEFSTTSERQATEKIPLPDCSCAMAFYTVRRMSERTAHTGS